MILILGMENYGVYVMLQSIKMLTKYTDDNKCV